MFVEKGASYSARDKRMHRMIEMLPVSKETVTLTGPMLNKNDMAELVEGLGKDRARKVPKLEKVFYEK